jgi:hypothetical protein
MTAKWTGYFKVVTPQQSTTKMTDSQEMADAGAYNNYTWYQRLVQGSASRMTRYREYDLMDNDIEVARALDTIAEEMTGNNPKTKEPLILDIMTEDEDNVESVAVLTLQAALRRWAQMNNFPNRLYNIARLTIKYGDVFFRKGKKMSDSWQFIHPKNVIAAVVDQDDATKVLAWQIKKDIERPRTGGYAMPLGAKEDTANETEIVSAHDIIRFSLNDDMSDTQPFGESVLRPVYRSHKQKELLEDAVIIYRVQRAPERRVFYIDVGKMPPQRVKQYLEGIKNEIKQKKIPTSNGGQSEVDSVYNPHSMNEDFFFASRPDGRGSRVETLPGGQGLGELSDLEYFQRKVWRGLKVPVSYMTEQSEGGQIWNDGKVGIAYIQELRFSLYIERLQGFLEKALDEEFKAFLRKTNIRIDESMYRIMLPEPSNFGKYRQLELDSQLLSAFTTPDGLSYMSKRYALKRYLQMSDEEIITNERLKREEMGIDPDSQDPKDLQLIYSAPEEGAMGGGGLGGGFGGAELGMGGEPIAPEVGTPAPAGGEAAGATPTK